MNRCRTLAAVLWWSVVLVKHGSRSQPIYGVRDWPGDAR